MPDFALVPGDGQMTPEDIKRLAQAGETLDVELKSESTGKINDDAIADAVVCLSNRTGKGPAWLLLGVANDGTIQGAVPRDGSYTNVNKMSAMIASKTRPGISAAVHEVPVDEKTVLAIEIPEASRPVASSKGVFLRRVHGSDGRPACHPMTIDDVYSLEATWGESDLTQRIVGQAQWDDLAPLEFDRFRQFVEERETGDKSLLGLNDLELAKALGVVEANGDPKGIRTAALLLFGRVDSLRRHVPTHEVSFQELRGLKVERNDSYRWPLLKIVEEFESRIRAIDREQELMVGFIRVGVSRYAIAPLREALANALMHRDYTELVPTFVQWQKGKIVVSSPGGFPRGVGKENLLVTTPRARNPLVANALKRAGVVDQTARGIDMMYYGQLKNGHPPPSYFHSNDWGVTVSLSVGNSNLGFARLVVDTMRAGREIEMDDMLLLYELGSRGLISLPDSAALIQKSMSEAHEVLDNLTEAGLVESANGNEAGPRWKPTARTRKAFESADGVDSSGQSPDEQKILGHVSQYGRITRSEVAALCGVEKWRASRILLLLAGKGYLRQVGRKRGTHYVRGIDLPGKDTQGK